LGVRRLPATRTTLSRRPVQVEIGGVPISVKVAFAGDQVMTVQPELADAQRAAEATGLALRDVLATATRLAEDRLSPAK
jgi:uncharacterized protein (DUF111 family)